MKKVKKQDLIEPKEELLEEKPEVTGKTSLWKKLPSSQKTSLVMFFLLLLIFPVLLLASFVKVNLFQKAAEMPITPPAISPTSSPFLGAYEIKLSKNPSGILTCVVNDPNCVFSDVFRAFNITDQTLYNTTIYFSSTPLTPNSSKPTFQYLNFDGEWTDKQSKTDKVVEPKQEAINSLLKMTPPPGEIGEYKTTLYLDGQTCKMNLTPPDCNYYGAGKIDIIIKVVPKNTPTPIPTLIPTPTKTPSASCRGCWNNQALCTRYCGGNSCKLITDKNQIASICGKPASQVRYTVYSCCSPTFQEAQPTKVPVFPR